MNHYKTPTALRRALEDRLLASVRRDGGDIQRMRRQAAFDRLLCRQFANFHLDVSAGDVLREPFEILEGQDWLGFAGIAKAKLPPYRVRNNSLKNCTPTRCRAQGVRIRA